MDFLREFAKGYQVNKQRILLARNFNYHEDSLSNFFEKLDGLDDNLGDIFNPSVFWHSSLRKNYPLGKVFTQAAGLCCAHWTTFCLSNDVLDSFDEQVTNYVASRLQKK